MSILTQSWIGRVMVVSLTGLVLVLAVGRDRLSLARAGEPAKTDTGSAKREADPAKTDTAAPNVAPFVSALTKGKVRVTLLNVGQVTKLTPETSIRDMEAGKTYA